MSKHMELGYARVWLRADIPLWDVLKLGILDLKPLQGDTDEERREYAAGILRDAVRLFSEQDPVDMEISAEYTLGGA